MKGKTIICSGRAVRVQGEIRRWLINPHFPINVNYPVWPSFDAVVV